VEEVLPESDHKMAILKKTGHVDTEDSLMPAMASSQNEQEFDREVRMAPKK